jgi:hypothetical protein
MPVSRHQNTSITGNRPGPARRGDGSVSWGTGGRRCGGPQHRGPVRGGGRGPARLAPCGGAHRRTARRRRPPSAPEPDNVLDYRYVWFYPSKTTVKSSRRGKTTRCLGPRPRRAARHVALCGIREFCQKRCSCSAGVGGNFPSACSHRCGIDVVRTTSMPQRCAAPAHPVRQMSPPRLPGMLGTERRGRPILPGPPDCVTSRDKTPGRPGQPEART